MKINEITQTSVSRQVAQLSESVQGQVSDDKLQLVVEAAQSQEFDAGVEADDYLAMLMKGQF